MQRQHCGCDMAVQQRDLAPATDEQARGVLALRVFLCWCQAPECRRKQVYTQELYSMATGPVTRVKRGLATLAKRLKQAQESDWVWSWHRETYGKVKWTVK